MFISKSHTYTNIDNMSITKDAGLIFIISKDKPLLAKVILRTQT